MKEVKMEKREKNRSELSKLIKKKSVEYSKDGTEMLYNVKIKEAYKVKYENGSKRLFYKLYASCKSYELAYYELEWDPVERILVLFCIVVRKHFIGKEKNIKTKVIKSTESIGKNLGAEKISIENIIKEEEKYWKDRPDYKFINGKSKAEKCITQK